VAIETFRLPAAIFVGLVLMLFLGPLLVFVPKLAALSRAVSSPTSRWSDATAGSWSAGGSAASGSTITDC
jgi:hypothetical protein